MQSTYKGSSLFRGTGFRNQVLKAVRGFSVSKQNGLFINSCFAHCQTERQDTWFADDSPVVGNKVLSLINEKTYICLLEYMHMNSCKTLSACSLAGEYDLQVLRKRTFSLFSVNGIVQAIAIAVGDWYFDRSGIKIVDCPYPCDKTCHNLVFQRA